MKSSDLRLLCGLVVLASLCVLAPGCSHETISGGSQNLNMTYTPSPVGAGRFERAEFIINRLQALPADPAEAALFGTERLLFRFNPFTADLELTTDVPYSNITLSGGTYVITRVEFSPLALVDTDVSTDPMAPCIDRIAVLDGSKPAGIPSNFVLLNPPSLTFTVQPGQTHLALTVDVPGLIADYEAAYTCQVITGPTCPTVPCPTLTAFSQTAYTNALLANITIK